jgi:hypothetical protein
MASPRIGQGPELMNVVNLHVRDVRRLRTWKREWHWSSRRIG